MSLAAGAAGDGEGGRLEIERGRAVQVDPINLVLKAPGIKRLKLKFDDPLPNFAFKFNLRRYNEVMSFHACGANVGDMYEAGAYTRPLFSST
jgi:hypothetical protein